MAFASQRMSARFACILLILCLSAACGGRAARPVTEQSSLDDRLSCEHLQGEHSVILARLRDAARDRQERNNNNAGFLLSTPFSPAMILFLDLTDTEKQETEALIRRNERLRQLARIAGCPPVPAITLAPAAAPPAPG